MNEQNVKLGFIGGGNMAEALIFGILRAGLFTPGDLLVADPSPERRTLLTAKLGIKTTDNSAEVAAQSEVILLAVKPQKIEEALAQIKPHVNNQKFIISIVAAITTRFLQQHLPPNTRVVRVMPNTPMLVGAGASAIARGSYALDSDLEFTWKLFSSGGKAVKVEEHLIDVVTSLSGCGPAYVFYLAEAMSAAGQKMGLSAADADLLARQTIVGAGRILEQTTDSPAELRRKVTSPGGFTEAAIKHMQTEEFFDLIAGVMKAAADRGRDLAR
ncbi:MAG TPA: pyrroline-5-carboxylate reductase [Phycisphaerae bacterium]|nr:pyrroline-5-carboxylate reductase [Phycisphaerae bacterium]